MKKSKTALRAPKLDEKSGRRWVQFRLWTLLVIVAILSLPSAYSLNWIRERKAMLQRAGVCLCAPKTQAVAPLPVRAFGGHAVALLIVDPWVPGAPSPAEVERLFPEAQVIVPKNEHVRAMFADGERWKLVWRDENWPGDKWPYDLEPAKSAAPHKGSGETPPEVKKP